MKIEDFNLKMRRQIVAQLHRAIISGSDEHSVVQPIKTPPRAIQSAGTGIVETVMEGIDVRTNLICAATTDVQKLNKLEKAFYNRLILLNYAWIGVQAITLKLADDCRLTCDFAAIGFNGELILWDVKGFQREDAFLKMKFAARSFRWAKFIIATRENGQWIEKEIKP